ncbi:RidA family protein [Streptomyces wedmorensis]|uniref:RidA family protein n=1 Tax=Streptomyces wedmorensis TaxID=43759 RepID=UPI00341CD389
MTDDNAARSGATAVLPPLHTRPIGKYSPGMSVPLGDGRRMVFVSGQVASDAEGRTIAPGDPAAQAEAVFERLSDVLEQAGGTLADLVSVVVYLVRMSDFAAVSEVRNRVLSDPAPASTLVEVSALAIADHLVEISGVAVVPDPS